MRVQREKRATGRNATLTGLQHPDVMMTVRSGSERKWRGDERAVLQPEVAAIAGLTVPGSAAAPHAPKPQGLRAMFGVRPTSPQWPVALRTAVCVAGPALVGWLVGDLPSGLLAAAGGFASLYGAGRPYRNRVRLLAVVACAQAAVVTLGSWASVSPWAGVVTVAVIAVLATWVCNAFLIQPGSYQITLTCATGTALHDQATGGLHAGLLVLSGGLLALLVHLSGALLDRYGPERSAVGSAAEAVADFVEGANTDAADDLQHEAAVAMHNAWIVLVNQQPHRRRTPHELLRLREISRTLQLVLADAMRGRRADPAEAARVRRLGAAAHRRTRARTGPLLPALPLGRPDAMTMLRATVAPGSRSLLVLARVAVAALAAGAIGTALGLSHTYWAVAAAVLVLSQGADQRSTVQRGLERTAGTVVGLLLCALLLGAGLQGLGLVVLLAVIVHVGQLLVPRNYAAATIFITCSALLMTAAGRSPGATASLLQARGLDTALGCAVAVVTFVLLSKKAPTGWLPVALADALNAAADVCDRLTPATVTSWEGLVARRDLQRRVIRVSEAYLNGINGFRRQRLESERAWPVVAAVERLAYRVLAESWRLEELVDGRVNLRDRRWRQPDPPPADGLRVLAEAIRQGRPPGPTEAVPGFLSRDVGDLRRLMRR